jgi:hypothetical protein
MTTAIPRTPEAHHESRKRPLLTRLGLVLAAVAGMVTMLSAPASAGPGDHGTDPLASGCANGASTIRTGTVGSISYEIRYSAACGTNWVRVPHLYGTVYMLIRSDWGGPALGGYQSDSGGGSHWTPQVYAPGSTCITYWVQQIGGGDPATGNVRIC